MVAAGQWRGFALWFAVAIVGHDLLLFPLYSLADLSLRHLLPGASRRRANQFEPVHSVWPPVINYIRIPAIFSLLLLMVWFPLILGLSAHTYHRASGLVENPYLGRWLGVTGVLFAASAFSYALALRGRAGRASRARRASQRASRHRHRFH